MTPARILELGLAVALGVGLGLTAWLALGRSSGAVRASDVGAIRAASSSCSGAAHRQFDFWVGDWEVEQEILTREGSYLELPARSSVRRVLDGCALLERWQGRVQFFWEGMPEPEPLEGLSVRSYDEEIGGWRIHWMDSRDPTFGPPFVGGFDGDTGTFTRETVGRDGAVLMSRIRFVRLDAERVDWDLSVSTDAGASWTALWRMRFRRASSAADAGTKSPDDPSRPGSSPGDLELGPDPPAGPTRPARPMRIYTVAAYPVGRTLS